MPAIAVSSCMAFSQLCARKNTQVMFTNRKVIIIASQVGMFSFVLEKIL